MISVVGRINEVNQHRARLVHSRQPLAVLQYYKHRVYTVHSNRRPYQKYLSSINLHKCCARATWRTTGHRFATLVVNKSYRRYAFGRTTSYVRQTLVSSHPGCAADVDILLNHCSHALTRTLTTISVTLNPCMYA